MGDNLKHLHGTLRRLRRQLKDLERNRKAVTDAIGSIEQLVRIGGGAQNGQQPARESQVTTAAIEALRASEKPMRVVELITVMQGAGWEADKTPDRVRATLVSALRRRPDVFSTPTRGVYGLREWEEDHEEQSDQH